MAMLVGAAGDAKRQREQDNINLARCRHSWRRPCLYFAPFVASSLLLASNVKRQQIPRQKRATCNFEREMETKVTTPQKKVVEEKVVEEEIDEEDSKASENGDTIKETKENGSSEEKEVDEKEAESTENGDSTDAPADSCCIKRKSTAGAEAGEDAQDGASPEKKSRLDEKCVEAENNGDAEEATA